jgi:hypothetical protein
MLTFDSRTACETALKELLRVNGLDFDEDILHFLVDDCEQRDLSRLSPGVFGLMVGHWVIRDDHIELIGLVKDSLLALASGKYVIGDLTASAITALTLVALRLVINVRKHSTTVDAKQLQILIALKVFGEPITTDDLYAYLRFTNSGYWHSANDVQGTLQSLTAMPTRAGAVKFVDYLPNGKWCVNNI